MVYVGRLHAVVIVHGNGAAALVPLGVQEDAHRKDRDLAIAAIHRGEKGLVDETRWRFLASLPVARSVAKLGYSFERAELEPTYVQPLMLDVPEPTNGEIEHTLASPSG